MASDFSEHETNRSSEGLGTSNNKYAKPPEKIEQGKSIRHAGALIFFYNHHIQLNHTRLSLTAEQLREAEQAG